MRRLGIKGIGKHIAVVLTNALIIVAAFSQFGVMRAYADDSGAFAAAPLSAQSSVNEKEPNDSFEQANKIAFGDTVNGKYNESGVEDYYKVDVPESGLVTVTFANDKYFTATFGCDFYLTVYNQYYESVGRLYVYGKETRPKTQTMELSKGVNYIKFTHDNWTNSPGEGHPYHFRLAYDVSSMTVDLFQAEFVYDGKAKEPLVTVRLGDKKLTAGVDYTVYYSNNIQPGKATVTVEGRGIYEGGATASFTILDSKQPMYRLYNPYSGEHFYTFDAVERSTVISAGWIDEGVGWNAPKSSSTPVYRMYNQYAGEHHYTMDVSERDLLVEAGWVDEGVGWYSDDAKTVPLYRDYNPYAFANNHNYTTDKSEHEGLVAIGWRDEGYAWYGV